MAITEVRIHPALGIARVGNSDSDFFIGPEKPWDREPPAGGYKDAQCRIKRQAARFRLFAHHDDGAITELDVSNATISWTVHLANSKAASDRFQGTGPRNVSATSAEHAGLVIDAGPQTISGADQRVELNAGRFTLPGSSPLAVPLGEIRTDGEGHLLVLGGFGTSQSPVNGALGGFADNSTWCDDVSDGSINAVVTVGSQTFNALGAWVVVAPPKFAPPLDNVIRLWDRLFDVFTTTGQTSVPPVPSYTDDIYPILRAANEVGNVYAPALGHHNFSHPVIDPATRNAVFGRLRGEGGDMPRLLNGSDSSQLTATQLTIMQRWKDGVFSNDWNSAWTDGPPPGPITEDGMDKAALENCVGAAFYPGIEAGASLLDTSKYTAPFRLDHSKVHPGDVCAKMAVPWQADFYACASDWWPIPRPNDVRPAGAPAGDPRLDWARGAASTLDFIANKWNKLGFITRQGTDVVEVDRCDTATTSINLVTPQLTFADIPQGPMGTSRSAARSATFEVVTASAVTLTFTAGPRDPSLTRFVAAVTVPPTGGGVVQARVWVIYRAPDDAHRVVDSITVTCAETNQIWVIPIFANSVRRTTAAAALVLDKSGSMSDDRGDGTSKSQSVRDAAKLLLDVMLPGDSISVTAFDSTATVLSPLTTLGDQSDPFDAGRTQTRAAVEGNGLDPAGNTSIGNGIAAGRSTLTSSTADTTSLLVLTDGMENTPSWISDVSSSIDATTYAVGLGRASNISTAALQTISGNNGGYLLVTGSLGVDNSFLLKKYFLQILAGISNSEVVLDPDGYLSAGEIQRIPFPVGELDNLVDVIVMTSSPQELEFSLEAPSGQVFDPISIQSVGGMYVATDAVAYYRVPLPVITEPGRSTQAGTWNAILLDSGEDRPRRRAGEREDPQRGRLTPYSVVVHAWSDLNLSATLSEHGYTPGSSATIGASLAAADIPFSNAVVWAEVTRPDGSLRRIDLVADDGDFTGELIMVTPGEYRVRVRASGITPRGWQFARERTLTASVWHGGDTVGTHGGPDDVRTAIADHDRRWCEMLNCVLSTLLANREVSARLKKSGVDLRKFRTCIDRLCPDGDAKPSSGQSTEGMTASELRKMIVDLQVALEDL